ncbi:hypothetical protein PRIPAC_77697, partial [Pristionchus pacificus]
YENSNAPLMNVLKPVPKVSLMSERKIHKIGHYILQKLYETNQMSLPYKMRIKRGQDCAGKIRATSRQEELRTDANLKSLSSSELAFLRSGRETVGEWRARVENSPGLSSPLARNTLYSPASNTRSPLASSPLLSSPHVPSARYNPYLPFIIYNDDNSNHVPRPFSRNLFNKKQNYQGKEKPN